MTQAHGNAGSKPKTEYSIQAVGNALRLLEAFRTEDEIGVSKLARRLDLHKNNVFRLLATLEATGYIDQCSSSEEYRLGPRCLELGKAYARGQDLLRSAAPILRALMERTRETAHLGILRDLEVMHLAAEQADRLVVAPTRVGMRLPVHCTALGKMLLAASNDEVREDFERCVIDAGGLVPRSAATILDSHKLFDQLNSFALQGLALDLGECESGMRCAAAPVFGGDGAVVAAISVSGPEYRIPDDLLLGEIAREVSTAAADLSSKLGYAN